MKNTLLEEKWSRYETVWGNVLRSLVFSIACGVSGCLSLPHSTKNQASSIQIEQENAWHMWLDAICEQIQSELDLYRDDCYTLEYIWQILREKLGGSVDTRNISVWIITPEKTKKWYAYIKISVTDRTWRIWTYKLCAENKQSCEEKIQTIRDNYMLYVKEKLEYIWSFSWQLTEESITEVLKIEKEGFEKHQMSYEIIPDGNNWMIVLHYLNKDEFWIFCLAGAPTE